MLKPIPSDKEIQKLMALNKPFLPVETMDYLQKLARLIKVQRRKIRYSAYRSTHWNVHISSNALFTYYWMRFRRRLNWIDLKHTIRKEVKPMLKSIVADGRFIRGNSRLPKRNRNK